MGTVNYRGVEIEIIPDENCESPDTWGDDGVFLVGYHRDFWVERKDIISKDVAADIFRGEKNWGTEQITKKYWCFGLEAYIHSGVVLALSNCGDFCDRQWDVSRLGLVLVSKEESRFSKKAREYAERLIETWNQYLSGDVYGYNIEQLNDSCWGYYGYDTCLQEAKSIVDYHLEENRKKRIVTLKQLIKSKVPLEYRQERLLTLSSTYN